MIWFKWVVAPLLLILFVGWLQIRRNRRAVLFSDISLILPVTHTFRVWGRRGLHVAEWMAFVAAILGYFNPLITVRKYVVYDQKPILFFLVDHSTSMQSHMGEVKDIIRRIVVETDGVFGLAQFARVPEVMTPPTEDKEWFFTCLERVIPVQEQKDNGTNIAYALAKMVLQLSRGSLILLTDGVTEVPVEDQDDRWKSVSIEEAVAQAKQKNISLSVGNFSGDNLPFTRMMVRFCRETGGDYLSLFHTSDMVRLLHKEIQCAQERMPHHEEKEERALRPFFAFFSLFLIIVIVAGKLTLFRKHVY